MSTERICFRLTVKTELIPQYRSDHERVWPEMQEELRSAGWTNYSLFLADDGLLVGYFETEDAERAFAQMAASSINARWQAEMAPYFVGHAELAAGQLGLLDEVFHL